MNLQIFDDLLDDKETSHIENFLRDPKFPWFLSNGFNHYTVDQLTYNENFSEDEADLESLLGVKKYPVRVKCAVLAWNTLEQALKEREL